MSIYHGLIVKAGTSLAMASTEGLLYSPDADAMIYVAAATPTVNLTTAGVNVSGECVGIVQVAFANGAVSVKYGSVVASASGLSAYPAPDTGYVVLAELFTPSTPINSSTTVVANSNISNLVKSGTYGGR